MDPTDDKIIAVLQKDASLAYKEVAKRLKMNESTVRKRIISLRRRRVIRGSTVDVDADKLGYKTKALLSIDAEPSEMLNIGKRLTRLLEARFVLHTSGHHDFWVVVWARNRDDLSRIISQVSAMEGVTSVVPSLVVERLK